MAKSNPKKHDPKKLSGKEAIFMLMPWSCKHHATHSEIEAYVAATGEFEIVAEIHDAAGVDAEVVANFLVCTVNDYEKNVGLLSQAATALEFCLACEGPLTWAAEHEASIILKRILEGNDKKQLHQNI